MTKEVLLSFEKEQKNRAGISISSMGYCPLQNIYLQDEKKKIEGEALVRMAIGTFLHKEFQDRLIKLYPKRFLVEEEVKVFGDLTGHYDMYDKGANILLDWKFFNDRAYKFIAEPHYHYKVQLQLYGLGFFEKYNFKPLLKLVYVNTTSFQEKEFIIPYPTEEEITKYKNIYEIVKNKDIKRAKEISPQAEWECGYCQFKEKCDIVIEKTKKNKENIILDEIKIRRLAELLKQKKEIEEEEEEIKAELKEIVKSDVETDELKIKYIAPSVRKELDKKAVENFIIQHGETLDKFYIQKEIQASLRITLKEM
jgi:hypothetical protein